MTTPGVPTDTARTGEPAPPQIRIGTAERNEATKALDAHLEAGRLDAEEYGNRVALVSVARTESDLEPLFADLPAPSPFRRDAGGAPPAQVAAPGPSTSSSPSDRSVGRQYGRRGNWWDDRPQALGGRAGEAVMAATPAVALIAFFILLTAGVGMAWLVFLAVPIVSGVIYGDSKGHKHARRPNHHGRGHGW